MSFRRVLGFLLLCASPLAAQTTTVDVRDRAGAPVAGTQIEIRAGDETVATATSGDDGTASVALPPGTYRARATAHGFVAGWSDAFTQAADATGVASVTLFPGSAIAGTMLDDDDQKVPGAALCLKLHSASTYPPYAFGDGLLNDDESCWESDENGQLATPVLPLGSYDLSIEAEGLVPRETTVTLEPAYPAQLWRLERGGSIAGLVRDAEDEPLAGATVRLRHRERELERKGASGEDGRFSIVGLAAGPWTVRVEPRNAVTILRDGVLVKQGVATDLGALRARAGLGLEGIVRNAQGEPLAGVEVQVRQAVHPRRPLRTVETDDEGRFLAAGLAEEAVHVLFDAPEGHSTIARENVEPPQRDMAIELVATGSACGTVLTEEGRVAQGISIRATPEVEGLLEHYKDRVTAKTSEVDAVSGEFCVEDVHPGDEVEIVARAAGYRNAAVKAPVSSGQEAGPIELTLRRGVTLEGTVVTRDGQPVPEATVRGLDTRGVYTDSFGEFRLTGLGEGINHIVADHPDYAREKREVMLPLGLEEDFRIELGLGGTIEGTVMRHDGQPVEGVPVTMRSLGLERLTDAEGYYRLHPVPPGERTVIRRARDRLDNFEQRRVEVVEGETLRVDFELGVVLEGNVLRGGVPQPGVTIVLAQPRDAAQVTDKNHGVQRTFSDETGAYRLAGVRPGWSTATLESGRTEVVRFVEVPPGDAPRLDLHLPDRPIRGTVVNAADDTPIAGAQVSVPLARRDGAPAGRGSMTMSSSNESGGIRYSLSAKSESTARTDAAGSFEVWADPLPEVQVSASAPGFRWTTVKVDPDSRTPLKLELSRETKLLVKVRDPQGNPAKNIRVCAVRQSEDGNNSTNCSYGGSDRAFFSLNEGSYKIQASAAGLGTQVLEREMEVTEDGSATEMVVTLVPGAPLAIRLAGNPVEGAAVASLIDPTGAERNDLVEDGTVDPATGDRRWTTWPLNPGTWTLTVDDGTGKALVRKVEVVPGPPIEVTLP